MEPDTSTQPIRHLSLTICELFIYMFHGSVYCHPLCSPTHLKASVTARQEAVKVCGKGGNGQELDTYKIGIFRYANLGPI
jgi:hypothetical protein